MLTAKRIRDAKPGQKARVDWDTKVKGLGLRITPGGAKSFVLVYRINGRQRWATLGRAGEIPLEDVRKMAGEWKHMISNGADPLEQRQRQREAPTMGQAVSRFFAEEVPERVNLGKLSERSARDYLYQWKHYLAPKLARRKVTEITRQHIERVISGRPAATRNKQLAILSRIFTLFEKWEYRPQHTNPCRGIDRATEEPRDRVLTAEELDRLAVALKEYQGNHAAVAAIRVAAFTGLRIGEVLGIKWENLDLDTGRLVLPETKTGRRQHTLPPPALEVLKGLPRPCEWVFTFTGKAPCTYRNVRIHFHQICADAGIEGVRLHDLRRTVMTLAAASGIGSHTLRDLLGHKTTAMADRYIRNQGDAVTEAREKVAAKIADAMKL